MAETKRKSRTKEHGEKKPCMRKNTSSKKRWEFKLSSGRIAVCTNVFHEYHPYGDKAKAKNHGQSHRGEDTTWIYCNTVVS